MEEILSLHEFLFHFLDKMWLLLATTKVKFFYVRLNEGKFSLIWSKSVMPITFPVMHLKITFLSYQSLHYLIIIVESLS